MSKNGLGLSLQNPFILMDLGAHEANPRQGSLSNRSGGGALSDKLSSSEIYTTT